MGRIKSALEIALEKTNDVKSDKASINQFEAKQRGKKFANEYLENGEKSIVDTIKRCPREELVSLKQGLFETLVTQVSLPVSEDDKSRTERAGKGIAELLNNKQFTSLLEQLAGLLGQYMKESAQYEQAIKQQYEPKLRQKEEELSRRMGREIRIDPFQDPEFAAFYTQNMNALKANYESALDQFKDEARRLFAPAGK